MAPDNASPMDESFIAYPINRVAGTIADRADAEAAVEALLQAGIEALLARFHRSFIHVAGINEESAALEHHVNDLRAGRFVIMVRAKAAAERQIVAGVLDAHRATFIGFFGRSALRALERNDTATPAADDPVVAHTYEACLAGSTTLLRVEPGYAVEVTPPGLSAIRITGTAIGQSVFITSWQEPGRNTVVQVNDTAAGKAYATIIGADGMLRQMNGTIRRLD
jgi:hypothetical protein